MLLSWFADAPEKLNPGSLIPTEALHHPSTSASTTFTTSVTSPQDISTAPTTDTRPSTLETHVSNSLRPTETSINSQPSAKTGGLTTGAKIGLGVGIAVLLILIGVVIFVVIRRRKRRPKEEDIDPSKEELGKQSAGNLISTTPSYPTDSAPGYQYDGLAGTPSGVREPKDDEEEDRPVSRAVSPIGEPLVVEERSAEDDNEMQWILEEERKVRERKEQQQRLPTKGSVTSWDGMTGSAS